MTGVFLVDTSAWIEFLRGTGSETNVFVRQLIDREAPISTTEPVVAELMCGARNEVELYQIEILTRGCRLLSVDNHIDYMELARILRSTRSKGMTVRKPFDCLIAAVALRNEATLVHHDRDFEHLAEAIPHLHVQRRDMP